MVTLRGSSGKQEGRETGRTIRGVKVKEMDKEPEVRDGESKQTRVRRYEKMTGSRIRGKENAREEEGIG